MARNLLSCFRVMGSRMVGIREMGTKMAETGLAGLAVLVLAGAIAVSGVAAVSGAIETPEQFDAESVMEVLADEQEVAGLLAEHPGEDYLVFVEDRRFPVRRFDGLPKRWVKSGPSAVFEAEVAPGEYFVFQIGIFAAGKTIERMSVAKTDLIGSLNMNVPSTSIAVFNLGGTDWRGKEFSKTVTVEQGRVLPLWVGIPIPEDASGKLEAELTIVPGNAEPKSIRVSLNSSGAVLEDHGDSELWRLSRLGWLNSKVGTDNYPSKPYHKILVRRKLMRVLGRQMVISDSGLPESIVSAFTETLDHIKGPGREILAGPVKFVIESQAGPIEVGGGLPQFTKFSETEIDWWTRNFNDEFMLYCLGTIEYDGYVSYRLILEAKQDVALKDVRLEIPFKPEAAKFLMGMGQKGGIRPAELDWKWDQAKHQDSLWIGDVNAGLRCQLKGANYSRPLVNIYYKNKPLNLPVSWHNEGRGGCQVTEVDNDGAKVVLLKAYSGGRQVKAGEKLHFNFDLLITPVKLIDYAGHWENRYYHNGNGSTWKNWIKEAENGGANIINIHHGNDLNPYINYPFLPETQKDLQEYVAAAHEKGMKAKIYYTVRELSNHVTELWALRSLGDEILADGAGNQEKTVINPQGAAPWLQQHLRTNYVPAWRHNFNSGKYKGHVDAAVVTSGMSRWHNYYLQGLKWLAQKVKIDGIYIDDVAYDRTVMQRARKILDKYRPGSLIDVHSWNHFNDRAGWANCANLYMEHFPYIDSIWFGEGFNYDESPDYWLIEISGIPYGLMGEMLQGGGNPWRGMVYGMTGRMPWSGDPTEIWKFWDEFGIEQAKMIGYWVSDCPVRTDNPDVLATVYQREGKTLVAVASWAKEAVEIKLQINWKALGLDGQKAQLTVPKINNFQEKAEYSSGDSIKVEPGKGYLIVISE
ncbi:MAG: hypothetical protein JXD22_09670 [Sedimentisphaerales bacterium]|nr:hypothetical protein [Sedimentisphaerales bacterium]